MQKLALTSVSAIVATLFLVTACAEEGTGTETTSTAVAATGSGTTDAVVENSAEQKSIMDQPVDFSSAEAYAKTLESIRQQDGDKVAGSIENTIGYFMVYDLSVKRDKEKLMKKLNGKTPNEILGMRRR